MESCRKSILSLFFLFSVFSVFGFSKSESILQQSHSQPQRLQFFKINNTQNAGSCSYSVVIQTSCSSPVYTRDQISISFGDAYGNQVYVPRIDDPRTRTFERCSSDRFDIHGPCTYQVCYVYLYRSGYDGWKVERVTISGYSTKSITFNYKAYIPNSVWYGFNFCSGYHQVLAAESTATV